MKDHWNWRTLWNQSGLLLHLQIVALLRCTSFVSTVKVDSKPRLLLPRLRAMVATLRVGDRLPGERELSQRWDVARETLRRCTNVLVAEGVLARRHGSGTYVIPKPVVRLLGLTSFSQDMMERGLAPASRLLSFSSITADDKLAARLRVPAGTKVIHFTRLRLAGGEAMALESVWIPKDSVPGLTQEDLDGSLYETLSKKYGITVASAKVTIDPVLPDSLSGGLLMISLDQACLRMRMVDLDARNRVIMIAKCIYRGDQYQLSADVTGGAFPSGQSQGQGQGQGQGQ